MYLDCSYSFGSEDIQKERALLGVLKEFTEHDELIIKIRYFAETIHDTFEAARRESGTSA